jgi:hypothetical protein
MEIEEGKKYLEIHGVKILRVKRTRKTWKIMKRAALNRVCGD